MPPVRKFNDWDLVSQFAYFPRELQSVDPLSFIFAYSSQEAYWLARPCPSPVNSAPWGLNTVSNVLPFQSPNPFLLLLWLGSVTWGSSPTCRRRNLCLCCQHNHRAGQAGADFWRPFCRALLFFCSKAWPMLLVLVIPFWKQWSGWAPGFDPLLTNLSLVLEMPLDLSETLLPSLRSLSYIDKIVTRLSGRCRVPLRW